ncbi:hypothetical protein [Aeromonas sanarellii]|uniref:hypothetical protein n=1 Tax=Aeromonas sanarellii TaxID=633415 RepID=UPI0038D011A2
MFECIKKLIIEFIYATAFAGVLGYLIIIIPNDESNSQEELKFIITFIFGGITLMLARRFMQMIINDFKKPYKAP